MASFSLNNTITKYYHTINWRLLSLINILFKRIILNILHKFQNEGYSPYLINNIQLFVNYINEGG